VLDEPKTSIYGGSVAAPVFRNVARRWLGTFPEIAARVHPVEEVPELPEAEMPDVTARPAAVAANLLLARGYRAERPGEGEAAVPVRRQRPAPGETAPPRTRVRLTVAAADTTESTMPDLTGLSAREATFWLASLGVNVRIEGRGLVAAQSPRAGAPLPERAVLRCRAKER